MTTTLSEPDGKCSTCGESHVELAARGVVPKHPFNDGSLPFKATFGDRNRTDDWKPAQRGAERPTTQGWPFDPVLRQALIDKGVLTPDDLRNAENKIHQMSVVFNQGGRGGEG